jgi:hypothetical protein
MLFELLRLSLLPWLPPCVGAHGGRLRIAVGLLILYPEVGAGLSLDLPPDFPHAYNQRPRPQSDPVGNLFSKSPLRNPSEFYAAWKQGRPIFELLNDDRYVRRVFRVLAPVQLARMLQALQNHRGELEHLFSLGPKKRKKKIRAAIHTLFRCQARPLDAMGYVSDDAEDQLDSAIAEVRKRYSERFVTDAFPISPRATEVTERGRAYLAAAKKDCDPAEDELMAFNQPDYGQVEAGRNSSKAEVQSKEAPLQMGSRTGLTRVDIEVVANAVRERTSSAVSLIALIVGLALPVKMIFKLRLKQVSEDWWEASYRIAPTHRVPKRGNSVLESRENLVVRYLPRAAVDILRSLPRGRKGRIRLDKEAEVFLAQLSPEYTVARIEQAMLIHGSVWFPGTSWLYLNSARRPGESMRTKQDAARSYTYISHEKAGCMLPLLGLVGITYSGLPLIRPGGWGSALCPRVDEIRQLFGKLDTLCEAPIPSKLISAILRLNAVMAVAHSAFLIYSGLRNYPMTPPSQELLIPGEVDWLRQKGLPSLVYIPAPCRRVLLHVCAYWEKWKMSIQQIYPKIFILEDNYCYRFVSLRSTPDTLRFEPNARHSLLIQGFLGEQQMRRWASLPPTSFRAFTNSYLRGLGYDEMSIRYFHHHSFSSLHYTRGHRQEPALQAEIREEIASLLSIVLGYESTQSW